MAGRPSKYRKEFEEQAFIYALRDPHGAIRYVGKTNSPAKRLESHTYPSSRSTAPVARWCRKLKRGGHVPALEVLEVVPRDSWEEAERRWIARMRREGHDLLNVSPGGVDMKHVRHHARRYPAYAWIMRFCARTGRRELATAVRKVMAKAAQDWGDEGQQGYEAQLRGIVLDSRPFVRI